MIAADLIRQAQSAGVELRLVDGKVKASGEPGAVAAVLPQLRAHRQALTQFLSAAHFTTAALIEAAMRACDQHGDGEHARQRMRADCLATPLIQQADLLDHFNKTYPESKP